MSLSNANYFNSARSGNLVENWFVKLFYDSEGAAEFIGIAHKDLNIGVKFYYGCIESASAIRDSIDLEKSTSKRSNVTITISNYTRRGSNISAELFGGTRDYLNRKIEIRSQLNGETNINNCLLLYTGKLVSLKQSVLNTIQLEIVEKKPWNQLNIPQTISDENIYQPLAYGNFINNSEDDFNTGTDNKKLYPVPFGIASNNRRYFITTKQESGGADKFLHYYEDVTGGFYPVDSSDTETTSLQSVNQGSVLYSVKRDILLRPTSGSGSWDNIENSYAYNADDGQSDTTVNASDSFTDTPAGSPKTTNFTVSLPDINGLFTVLTLEINAEVEITALGNSTLDEVATILLDMGAPWNYTDTIVTRNGNDGIGTTVNATFSKNILTEYQSNNYQLPESITIQAKGETTNPGDSITATYRVKDIHLAGSYSIDFANEPQSALQKWNSLIQMYVGYDGLTQGYTGGSGSVTKIHEAHRDILNRFVGIDEAAPDGWASLDSSKDWEILYWLLEPEKIEKVLARLQYEGGFIFKFGADQGMKYIHIPDGAPTVAATLGPDDITSPIVMTDNINDLITKMDVKYQKNPAKSEYILQQTAASAAARTQWNIQTDEDILEVKLDAYSSPAIPATPAVNPNDDWYSYYDNIVGDVHLVIEFNLLNPVYSYLETGDFIKLSADMSIAPFGDGYAQITFMITKTQRSRGKMSITAQEVYST